MQKRSIKKVDLRMKCDVNANTLKIKFSEKEIVSSSEMEKDIIVHYDEKNSLVGYDIKNFSDMRYKEIELPVDKKDSRRKLIIQCYSDFLAVNAKDIEIVYGEFYRGYEVCLDEKGRVIGYDIDPFKEFDNLTRGEPLPIYV